MILKFNSYKSILEGNQYQQIGNNPESFKDVMDYIENKPGKYQGFSNDEIVEIESFLRKEKEISIKHRDPCVIALNDFTKLSDKITDPLFSHSNKLYGKDKYITRIYKDYDEYYYIFIVVTRYFGLSSDFYVYKCDQIEGLKQCLKDIL